LGATISGENTPVQQRSALQVVLYGGGMTFLGLLTAIAGAACLAGVAMFVFLSLFFMGFLSVMIHGLFSLLA